MAEYKDNCKVYSSDIIQRLYKLVSNKDNTELVRKKVFPVSIIQAIYDKLSGITLDEILRNFNCIYVLYKGTKTDTRLSINTNNRRRGLIIVYTDLDNITYTQRFIGTSFDDSSWGSDSNWEDCFVGLGGTDLYNQLKTYIDELFQSYIGFHIEVIDELPATGQENVLYMIPADKTEENNQFTEYIWIADDKKYEVVGSMNSGTVITNDGNTPIDTLRITEDNSINYSEVNNISGYIISRTTDDNPYLWVVIGYPSNTVPGVIKTGYLENNNNYATKVDENGKAYITVPYASNTQVGVIGTGYSENNNNYAVKTSTNKAYVTIPIAINQSLGLIKGCNPDTYFVPSSIGYTGFPIKASGGGEFFVEIPQLSQNTSGLIAIGYEKNGNNYPLKVDENGKGYVTVDSISYNLPVASNTELGGIKVAATTEPSVNTDNDDYNVYDVSINNQFAKVSINFADSTNAGIIKLGYSQNDKNYPVQLDSNGKAFVNVPWTGGGISSINVATSEQLGGIKIGYINTDNNYALLLDSSNKAYVTVPIADYDVLGLIKFLNSDTPIPSIANSTSYALSKYSTGYAYVNIPYATSEKEGLLTKEDKAKLDKIESSVVILSQSDYDGLDTKDENTLYVIK